MCWNWSRGRWAAAGDSDQLLHLVSRYPIFMITTKRAVVSGAPTRTLCFSGIYDLSWDLIANCLALRVGIAWFETCGAEAVSASFWQKNLHWDAVLCIRSTRSITYGTPGLGCVQSLFDKLLLLDGITQADSELNSEVSNINSETSFKSEAWIPGGRFQSYQQAYIGLGRTSHRRQGQKLY